MARKPDHTGVFVPSLCAMIASDIFAALLIYSAAQQGHHAKARYTSARNQILGGLIDSIADAIGLWGSVGLSVVLVAVSGVFFVRAIRRYRALVAASR